MEENEDFVEYIRKKSSSIYCFERCSFKSIQNGVLLLDYKRGIGFGYRVTFFYRDKETRKCLHRRIHTCMLGLESALSSFSKVLSGGNLKERVGFFNFISKSGEISKSDFSTVNGSVSDALAEDGLGALIKLLKESNVFDRVELVFVKNLEKVEGGEKEEVERVEVGSNKFMWNEYEDVKKMNTAVIDNLRKRLLDFSYISKEDSELRITHVSIWNEDIFIIGGGILRKKMGKPGGQEVSHTFVYLEVESDIGKKWSITVERYHDHTIIKMFLDGNIGNSERKDPKLNEDYLVCNIEEPKQCFFRLVYQIILESEFESKYNLIRRNCKSYAQQIYLFIVGSEDEYNISFRRFVTRKIQRTKNKVRYQPDLDQYEGYKRGILKKLELIEKDFRRMSVRKVVVNEFLDGEI